jgi:aromatic-L-amino-acid/L-tryptophan decarboxylase
MPSNVPNLDPYVTSVQWSRRFLGLRLFLSLAAAGWAGYGEHVERAVEFIASLRAKLICQGWSIANNSPLAVLCVEPPPGRSGIRSIVNRVLASGRAWISPAIFEDREVIRACVTNGETMLGDIDALVDVLQAAARADSITSGYPET